METKKRGNPTPRTVYYTRVALWVYPDEWDRMNYLASAENKTVSRYVYDLVKVTPDDFIPEVPKRDKSKIGSTKVLAFETSEAEYVKLRVKKSGLGTTKFIMGIVFGK